jgi:hypothetical protein
MDPRLLIEFVHDFAARTGRLALCRVAERALRGDAKSWTAIVSKTHQIVAVVDSIDTASANDSDSAP